jgi:hypothetical protein
VSSATFEELRLRHTVDRDAASFDRFATMQRAGR